MFIISTVSIQMLHTSKDPLEELVRIALQKNNSLKSHEAYSNKKQIPEEGTYYYRVYLLIENIYRQGLSEEKYQLLKEEKDNFYIEGEEIIHLAETVKETIKKELRWREEQRRPYLKYTITKNFEEKKIILNVKEDIDDIRIVRFLSYLEMLEDAYQKGEKLYFCRYTPPPSE